MDLNLNGPILPLIALARRRLVGCELTPCLAPQLQEGCKKGGGVISCRFVLNSRPHHSGFYILGYIRVPDVLKLRYDEKATLVPWFQFIPRMLVRLQVLGSGVLRGLLGRGIVPYVR